MSCLSAPAVRSSALPVLEPRVLEAWLRQARPGDAFEYYRGLLGPARSPLGPIKVERQRRALERLAVTAWDLAESGRVHLMQRRAGPGSFSYLAIARYPATHQHPESRR